MMQMMVHTRMMRGNNKRRHQGVGRRQRRGQKGGFLLPLLAMTLLGGAASFGIKKALAAATK